MAKKLAFDRVLFTTVALLIFFGLVMVYSASAAIARERSPLLNPFLVKQALAAAVRAAAGAAAPGEAVVLSPACASFDQFDNFAHRGEVFKREVRAALAAGGGTDGQEAGV